VAAAGEDHKTMDAQLKEHDPMRITVVLCTYNRHQSLRSALNSVAASVLPESVEWEILVVDNNSTDQTRKVVEEFCSRHPGWFRYLFEAQQGKSYALNSGIREARGNILAFMDDDVTVHPNWLQNLTAALRNDEWVGAGGRIVPEWTFPPPCWLAADSRHAAGPLVGFDPSPNAGRLNEAPIGANMAFRKDMFEKYGYFRTDLGPRPGSEIRNEDTEFGDRLLLGGERLRYEPSALVFHPVTRNRIEKKYFLRWWYHKGEATIRQFGVRPGTKYYIGGIPLFMFRNLVVWTCKWMAGIHPARRFSSKLNVWIKVGEIAECYRHSQEIKKRTENCSALEQV
jgi:glycosyltransferase involved in cell wall biosynthesis